MNTRSTILARTAALLVMLAALFLAPAAQAQLVDCTTCDHFTIGASSNLNCSVTICYTTGAIDICQTVAPGQSIKIPCTASRVWTFTCSGIHTIYPSSSTALCGPALKFEDGCCARICTVPSTDNCTRLEIQPLPCLTPGCP